jgi:hypothetical protein
MKDLRARHCTLLGAHRRLWITGWTSAALLGRCGQVKKPPVVRVAKLKAIGVSAAVVFVVAELLAAIAATPRRSVLAHVALEA